MKTYRVFWTGKASLDLEEIIDYISRDKHSAAISVYRDIKNKCHLLNENPERYRIIPELSGIGITNYREIIHKPYRIIFKLTETTVYLMAVVDGRRDFESFIYNRIIRDG